MNLIADLTYILNKKLTFTAKYKEFLTYKQHLRKPHKLKSNTRTTCSIL